ncbi:DUF3795 domain-containing protein [candidate division KSB1 bacterium]
MTEITARCGYRCDLCLAFRKHVKSEKDRKRFKDGLFKFYNYRIKLENCYCDGCLADEKDPENKLMDQNCKIRLCVMDKNIKNCGYCDEYPCSKVKSKFIDFEKVAAKQVEKISEDDYENFILPYENLLHLDEIRKVKGLE